MATRSHGDPDGNIPQDKSLCELQQVLDWVNVMVDQTQVWLWAYVEVELINPDHWNYLPQVRGGASYLMLMIPVSILPGPWWGGEATSPECWSWGWYRSSIRVRTSSLAVMSGKIHSNPMVKEGWVHSAGPSDLINIGPYGPLR